LFFLLSILFFVRWLRAKELSGRTRGGWDYALSLLFAALAMASKSSTVILPAVLCLCAWWIEGRWHWRNVTRVVPIFLISIAASAVSIWTQGFQLATVTDPRWMRTWPERLATAGDAVWFYLGKLLWPHPLITIYPRWQIDARQWVSYLPLLAVIITLAILWLKRERWSRAYLFAFTYFIAALLPVVGLIDNYVFHFSLVFDHFQYLASMGALVLAGAGLARFSDFYIPKKPWLQSAFCAGLLLVLGTATWQRTWAYENREALWSDTLSKDPNCWAGHNNLGLIFFGRGQVDEAIDHFRKALQIYPNYPEAHSNLGNALLQKGQLDEALAQFQEAVKIAPQYARGHYNFGNTLLQHGQLDEAIAQLQKALEIDPNYVEAHGCLGDALLQKGQVDEAVAQFQKAAEIAPNSFVTHYNFGVALVTKRQLDEAAAQYQRALEINPKSLETHFNLGLILLKKRQTGEAITQFMEVLRLKPDFIPARDNLAKAQALARQGDGNK